jgi:hypothetical protein
MEAIREATKWYQTHLTTNLRVLKTNVPEIVLLTNDQGNLNRAKAISVTACSSTPTGLREVMVVEEYIKDLKDGDMLMDMMSANIGYERTTRKLGENLFPEVEQPKN